MSDPDWLTPGAKAVLYTPNRLGAITRLRHVIVTRLTKTRVVFHDGTWINRQTLTHRNDTWGPSTQLLPASDPKVVEAEYQNRVSGLQHATNAAHELWWSARNTPSEVEALDKLIERATALRDAMNRAS